MNFILISPSLARAFGDSERYHVPRYRTALLFGKNRHDDGQPIAMGMSAAAKGRTMCLDGGNAERSRPRRRQYLERICACGSRPRRQEAPQTIPLAKPIAGATVEAFEQR